MSGYPLCFTHRSFFHTCGFCFLRIARAARRSCSRRAATGGIAGGWRREATAGRSAAAAARAAADDDETTLPSSDEMGLSRGGVSASSGASLDGSGDFCWTLDLVRLGWVSTGTGGGIGEGVATGVFVDDEEGSVGEDGGAMLRQSMLSQNHCALDRRNYPCV